jgi:radical SAM superfamily enzyme YgiQ (UPF0313 family)
LIIGTTTINKESTHTLGLEIITRELLRAGYDVRKVDHKTAKDCDIILVSLYWIDQLIDYPAFLFNAQINPKEKKPVIIIGGSCCLNPWPIKDMFHYAVIGDGEGVTLRLIQALEVGNDPCVDDSVLSNGYMNRNVKTNVAPTLIADHFIEERTNKVTRIEIARGCKSKCKFCQLTHIKPYREIPPVLLKNLIVTAPTKSIALFAPDRGSYSGYKDIERWCLKYGKNNIGTDIKLMTLKNMNIATSVRFGIEGFSEKDRLYLGKPYKHKNLVDDFLHLTENIKTPKGKDITVATWYMIIGTPAQGEDDYAEFAALLRDIDSKIKAKKFCIFLTLNDFSTPPHTPLENAEKNISTDHYKLWMKHKPRLENITIAQHGGARNENMRIYQALAFRGGQNSNKAIFNISKNKKILQQKDGRIMLDLLKKTGVDVDGVLHGYVDKVKPWQNIFITGS